jgi:hypothetical protein
VGPRAGLEAGEEIKICCPTGNRILIPLLYSVQPIAIPTELSRLESRRTSPHKIHNQPPLSVTFQLNNLCDKFQVVINMGLPVKFVQLVDLSNDIHRDYCSIRDYISKVSH